MLRLQGEPRRAEVQSYSEGEQDDLNVLCARCYSLRHYGCASTLPMPVCSRSAGA